MGKVSLCMIVKDEERHIRRCLESVKNVVDEMIIVDTGSTDQTIEICQTYGATILRQLWRGSFADARNYGLEAASGDWILFLDADEELHGTDAHLIRTAAEVQDVDLMSVQVVNYTGKAPDPDEVYVVDQYRIFRRDRGFRFRNRIHEILYIPDTIHSSPVVVKLAVTIYHYGYLDSETELKDKFKRNMQLLRRELAVPKHDPWVEYHMASEYYRIGNIESAIYYVNKSILEFLRIRKHPPSLLYKLKYEMMLTPDRAKEALLTIDYAIMMHKGYVDLLYYKGILLHMDGRFQEALRVFDACLDMGEGDGRHLTLKGTGSYRAWYYKGKCYEGLEQPEDAGKCYAHALTLAPQYREAAADLHRVLRSINLDTPV
ncbi:glycosyltransferase [Paenibacillus daejeonensis]|uniref:glycosyltransferase n=1 Tax=Paenibacillus daejeonensis TaxID=135193 RepID=UPI0003724E62|nr:glycosyltransferase [Paenibacillus daejeonensis]